MRTGMLRELLIAAVAGLSCQPVLALPVSGRVLLVRGDVQAHEAAGAARPIPGGTALAADVTLKTGVGGLIALSLTPGIAVVLTQTGEMKVEALRVVKQGAKISERYAQLRLQSGLAQFSVGSPSDRLVGLKVMAKSLTVECEPGSLFSVALLDDGKVFLVCARGAVRWRDAGRQQNGTILNGQFQQCETGLPTPCRPVSEDAGAQSDVLGLFDTIRLLSELQKQLPGVLTPRLVRAP